MPNFHEFLKFQDHSIIQLKMAIFADLKQNILKTAQNIALIFGIKWKHDKRNTITKLYCPKRSGSFKNEGGSFKNLIFFKKKFFFKKFFFKEKYFFSKNFWFFFEVFQFSGGFRKNGQNRFLKKKLEQILSYSPLLGHCASPPHQYVPSWYGFNCLVPNCTI